MKAFIALQSYQGNDSISTRFGEMKYQTKKCKWCDSIEQANIMWSCAMTIIIIRSTPEQLRNVSLLNRFFSIRENRKTHRAKQQQCPTFSGMKCDVETWKAHYNFAL